MGFQRVLVDPSDSAVAPSPLPIFSNTRASAGVMRKERDQNSLRDRLVEIVVDTNAARAVPAVS